VHAAWPCSLNSRSRLMRFWNCRAEALSWGSCDRALSFAVTLTTKSSGTAMSSSVFLHAVATNWRGKAAREPSVACAEDGRLHFVRGRCNEERAVVGQNGVS
jgi:hypothetical protein